MWGEECTKPLEEDWVPLGILKREIQDQKLRWICWIFLENMHNSGTLACHERKTELYKTIQSEYSRNRWRQQLKSKYAETLCAVIKLPAYACEFECQAMFGELRSIFKRNSNRISKTRDASL